MASSPSLDPENSNPYRLIHDVYVLLDFGDRLVLDRFDLTPTQFRLLNLMDVKHGRRFTALSLLLIRSKSQITRTVDMLQKRKLISRSEDREDGRAQLVVLTPAGVRMRDQINREHATSLRARFASLSSIEQASLKRMLIKLRTGMSEYLEVE